ncbi:hypothetical protein FO519_006817 [Halicephalobus sp. NKZ332]|nr:hypothetical protein FO519_006817 [Halicephalobus sp. NKZ332]
MTTIVQEGRAKLVVDNEAETESFYNPVMQFNRDLTVTVMRQFVADRSDDQPDDISEEAEKRPKKKWYNSGPVRVLDALSATGLRAIRFAQEVPEIQKIVANDFSESSVKNIKRNVAENGLENLIEVNCDDAKLLMMKHTSYSTRFHIVDLDPYGTAAPFLDAAVQSVADGGLLMVTCTDMAVLCGNAPEACFLKYKSTALKHSANHEMALRILVRAIDAHANVYGRYVEPVLSVSIDYYIRVFVKVFTSPSKAKLSAARVANVLACTGCKAFELIPILKTTDVGNKITKFTPTVLKPKITGEDGKCRHCDSALHLGGPIYSAPIQDKKFLEKLLEKIEKTPVEERLGTHERLKGILTVISEELHDQPLYLIRDTVMSAVKATCVKQTVFHSIVLNAGYKISNTHCNPKGFKTDAPMDFILDIARSMVEEDKVKSLNQLGQAIMAKGVSHVIDQKHNPQSVPESVRQGLVRYQCNHGKSWGPKTKAKGSVHGVAPVKRFKLDEDS